ncbi:MAG: glycoside hydrolase family 30 protein [Clostridia bacterium]|nr:glycoside hydrolase family 30 protein [Clostridia bacterium]
MNRLVLNPEKTYQTFENFGVSGAWWAQVIGGWTEIDEESGMPKRERISQLLFDKEKGIGVRCYRYNLGGGSAQSGNGNIPESSRRAESFYTDGGYDWSRDENAVWMLNQAIKDGADEIIFFVNSPPERWTKNGKAHLDKAFRTNLAPENYRSFANYCLDCVEHFRALGVPVRYLSPVNEPVWKWTGGQEGCHYKPSQVKKLMRVFVDEMNKRPSLADLKLSGAENGDIRWFNKSYCRVMLGDEKIRTKTDAIDTHSYFLTPPIPVVSLFIKNRIAFMKRFRKYMDRRFPGVPIKTSEWTHMQGGRDYGIDSALEQTKIIMEDLSVLNVTSWQLWIAVSNVDYCDGLIYENDEPRTFELTKRYYAFGNFSKFIENGSVRFEVDAGDNLNAVGFAKDGRSVVVIANRNGEDVKIELPENTKNLYVTSEEYSLTQFEPVKEFTLPAKSVTTIII